MNNRQVEILNAIRRDEEKLYWLTGGARRLQVASINLKHEPVLGHDELEECLILLTAETYIPAQRKLIEAITNQNTLAALDGGLEAFELLATDMELELSKADLIKCFQYIVWRVDDVLGTGKLELEILEGELDLMAVCEVCGNQQEHEAVHLCEYCGESNN